MTKFIKITDEKKTDATTSFYNEFSDLSFWLHCCLEACQEVATNFTGKKVTRKNWEAADSDNHDFVTMEFLIGKFETIGLGKRDVENLWRELRAHYTAELEEEFEGCDWTEEDTNSMRVILDRFSRISYNTILLDGKSLLSLESLVNVLSNSVRSYWNSYSYSSRDQNVRAFTRNINALITLDDCHYPRNPTKALDHLMVKLMRKAMRNVGLRPDATKVWVHPTTSLEAGAALMAWKAA